MTGPAMPSCFKGVADVRDRKYMPHSQHVGQLKRQDWSEPGGAKYVGDSAFTRAYDVEEV